MNSSIFFIVVTLTYISGQTLKNLGSFPLYDAAFSFIANLTPTSPPSLFVTSFTVDPFDYSKVYYIDNISKQTQTNFSEIVPTVVAPNENWPNEAVSGYDVFKQPTVVVAGGFLVPGHTTGQITVYRQENDQSWSGPFKISTDKSGYFYHRTVFADINGDGALDILTARATKPIFFGSEGGELLWYENPGPKGNLYSAWKEHVLLKGPDAPDIDFRFADLDGDGKYEVLAAQYFVPKFAVYYKESGNWTDATPIKRNVISSGMPGFDLTIFDLNNDKKDDVLITYNSDQPSVSSMWAYEIPTNWKTAPWPSHKITSGIITKKSGQGSGAPGAAIPFYPDASQIGKSKPWIALSGDDGFDCWLYEPLEKDWTYRNTTFLKTVGTVGKISVADTNGNGMAELYVPEYGGGKVDAFEFHK